MAIPSILLVYVLACYIWGAVFALRLVMFRRTTRPKTKTVPRYAPLDQSYNDTLTAHTATA